MKQQSILNLVLVVAISIAAYKFFTRNEIPLPQAEVKTQEETEESQPPRFVLAQPLSADSTIAVVTAEPAQQNQNAKASEPASERKPAALALEQKIKTTLQKWNPQTEFLIVNKTESDTILVRGGDFLVSKAQTEAFALQFAAQIGLLQNTLQRQSPAEESVKATDFSEVVEYQQFYKGYFVENSSLRLFRRNSDQRIYHVASNVKPITNLEDNIQVSSSQAEQTLLNEFDSTRKAATLKKEERPVVYFDAKTPQLCWKYYVKLAAPTEERQIYVSAITGKIVGSYYTLEH